MKKTASLHHLSVRGARACALLVLLFLLLTGSARPALAAQTLHLPYPAGLKVEIIQGYNAVTHVGVERYSLDLVRADGATNGSPVVAPASGSVAFAQPVGGDHGCIGVTMDDSGDYHYMLCHIILNHAYSYGDRIQVGQSLGTVGAPGLVGNNGTSHIHMQLYTLPDGNRTPQPYAPPDGLPLEGVTMPSDGSFNQWACSGVSCDKRFVSANPTGGAYLTATTSPPAALTSTALIVGGSAVVTNTGDCLRIHAQPQMSAVQTGCVPDGTSVYLKDGPSETDGHTWWDLSTLGWAVADYLRPAGGDSGTAPPPPAPPPTPSQPASTSSTGGAPLTPPPSPSSSSASPAPSTSLAVGVLAHVNGTDDCLRLHQTASLDSDVVGCLQDGTPVTLKAGPQTADGHAWWLLDFGGWAVADYLQVAPTQPASSN